MRAAGEAWRPREQQRSQHVVGQMVQRKGHRQAIHRSGPPHGQCPRIIHQDIDARLHCSNFRPDSPLLGQDRKVGEMHRMTTARGPPPPSVPE